MHQHLATLFCFPLMLAAESEREKDAPKSQESCLLVARPGE